MPLRLEVWSTRFWGTPDRVRSFLQLIESVDSGALRPERWNEAEPLRYPYAGSQEEIAEILCMARPKGGRRVINSVFFRRTKPAAQFSIEIWRGSRPRPNYVKAELDGKHYYTAEGSARVKGILVELVKWGECVYGFSHPTGVPHSRWVPLTPFERLEQVGWLNFFGWPYVEMFGEQRLRSAPWYSVEEVAGLGLLCEAAPALSSPEIIETADHLLSIEAHLGKDAFAKEGFPRFPCRVPQFDFSELVSGEPPPPGVPTRVRSKSRRTKSASS